MKKLFFYLSLLFLGMLSSCGNDEEEYLLAMGDRQDLRLNMTKMTDEEMEKATLEGLSKCNTDLAIGLDKEHLIKTQYYRKAKKS